MYASQLDELVIKRKVERYQGFIENRLKVDLRHVLMKRDKLYQDISDYEQLKDTLTMIQEEKLSSMKTKINIGCEMFMQADIPDTKMVYLDMGLLGLHVEFTIPEALVYIKEKNDLLTKQAELLTTNAATIKAHIKVIYEGIAELLNVPQTDPEFQSSGFM